jgi:two-component system chemotaxis sensor kinase CheA
LVGEQELMIKRLGWPLRRVRNVGGMAILGSGETTVILNPADLFKTGLKLIGTGSYLPASSLPERTQQRRRVLVADDSLTTRTLERSILESAGYDTAVAGDGLEALKVLRSQSIDLVVSDVNMPHLDGFDLTAEIRRDEKLRRIPVVLVTSLDAREHRERGAAVGADAYIVKGDFDQNLLLETIERLL